MGGLQRRGCPGGLVKMWIREKGVVSIVLDAESTRMSSSNVGVIGDINGHHFGGS